MDDDLWRYVGRVTIARELFDSSPDLVQQIFWTAIPVRAEARYDLDAIDYTLLCRQFKRVERGQLPWEYRAMFTNGRFVGFEQI
jgi:hypothetical protein